MAIATHPKPVDPARAPKALLRFPGPCGIRDFLCGRLRRLASAGEAIVYFTACHFDDIATGVAHFGALVILKPIQFQIVQTREPHIFIGQNCAVDAGRDVAWVPPRVAASVEDWSGIGTKTEIEDLTGPDARDERLETLENVNRYFSEVSDLVDAGFSFPDGYWFLTRRAERVATLAKLDLKSRWT